MSFISFDDFPMPVFDGGFPSHPCFMEESELDPSTLCHSAGIIIPSTAEKKRPDLSYVGGRMKHIHCRFPKYSRIAPIVDWLHRCEKQTHISIWHSNIAMENHPFSSMISHLNVHWDVIFQAGMFDYQREISLWFVWWLKFVLIWWLKSHSI